MVPNTTMKVRTANINTLERIYTENIGYWYPLLLRVSQHTLRKAKLSIYGKRKFLEYNNYVISF